MSKICSPLVDWEKRFALAVKSLGVEDLTSYPPDALCSLANAICHKDLAINSVMVEELVSPKLNLVSEENYFALLLNAQTQMGAKISLGAAGIIYFDPALALYAAIEAAKNAAEAKVLPQAKDEKELEIIANEALAYLSGKENNISQKMQAVLGFLGDEPCFYPVTLTGEDCLKLTKEGGSTVKLGGALTFVELFA